MTKKEFYSLIDEFIKAGYDEEGYLPLIWTTEPKKGERCGIPARESNSINIRWYKDTNYQDWTEYGIEIYDYGTWYEDDRRRYVVKHTNTRTPSFNCDYTTAEEVLEGFEEDYGQAYRYWKRINTGEYWNNILFVISGYGIGLEYWYYTGGDYSNKTIELEEAKERANKLLENGVPVKILAYKTAYYGKSSEFLGEYEYENGDWVYNTRA